MKRIFLMLVVALFAINAEAGSGWLKTVGAAQKEAKKKNQLIFVDLFAEWCGWCKRAEQDVFPSETFQKATDDMVLLRLDTEDRGEGTLLAQNLQVTSLPTFLILTDDLMIAGVIHGYAPADQFSAQVVKQRDAYRQFEKETAASPDPSKELEASEKLIARRGFVRAEGRLKSLVANKLPSTVRERSYYTLAVAQMGTGNFADSLKTLDQLDKFRPSPKLREDSAFLRGQLYLQQNQLKPALAEFKRFKTKYPKSQQADVVNALIPQIESALKRAQ